MKYERAKNIGLAEMQFFSAENTGIDRVTYFMFGKCGTGGVTQFFLWKTQALAEECNFFLRKARLLMKNAKLFAFLFGEQGVMLFLQIKRLF